MIISRLNWKRVTLAILAMLALGTGGIALRLQTTAPATPNAPLPRFEGYVAEPGEGRDAEAGNLLSVEAFWNTRVTYPTGRFQTAWLLNAAQQDKHVSEAVPAGRVTYSRDNNRSPLTLDPNSWTALGPQPLQSIGCIGCYSYGHVAGRVNKLIVDPATPSVAYLGAVDGGIWKTTNCCSATTTWTAMTDDPLIFTVAIDDITIDANNHNTVYAGTGDLNFGSFSMGSAGILKTTDAGATWAIKGANVFGMVYPQPSGSFPQYQAVGKVQVNPRNSNTIVAGAKTGVYFSYDGGDTWSGPCLPDSFTTQRQDVTGLLLHDNGSSTDMYVAVGARGYSTTVQSNLAENGANGIYKSTVPSSGCPATWTLSSRPDNGWPVGTGSGIPVYQAGGDVLGRIDLAMAPSDPSVIYAQVQAIQAVSGQQRGGQLGVWRTTDGGTTWEQRSGVSGLTGCAGDYPQNWYDQGMAVDPNDSNTVFLDTFDIFRSANGGTTFTDLTCGYNGGNQVHVDQHALAFVPGSSTTLLAGSDGGSYVTLNANAANPTWSQLNDSLNTIEFYSGDITANFANSSAPGINAGAQDNGSAVNVWGSPTTTPVAATMWQLRKGGDGMFARIEPVLGLRWYQESQNGALAVTSAGPYGGQTSATGGWSGDTRSFVFPYEIYKYDCPGTGCTHLVAGSTRVWETIQGGQPTSSWYINSPNLTKQTLLDRSFINQLSYAVSLSTTVIVGTNDGNVQYGFGLGQGTANTATWVNVTGGNSVLPNRPILDVTTDPVNPLVGYAAIGGFDENTPSTPGHVYMVTCTADCASFTWANKSGNLPNIPVDSILANPLYPQQVFAGSDWGLYYTNDVRVASPTWSRFNTGMPNAMIWDMSIDRGFTTLAAFTRGRGAYVWPLPAGPVGSTPTPTFTGTPPTATRTPTTAPTSTPTRTPTPASTPCTGWGTVTSPNVGTGANQLFGVAAVSANDVWAVGYSMGVTATDQTLIEHWNGSAWSVVPSPNVGGGHNILYSVVAFAANNIVAVGDYRVTSGGLLRTLMMSWDGSSWNVVTSPNSGTGDNSLYWISAVTPSDIWAVGEYRLGAGSGTYQTLTMHYDGTTWSVVTSPNVGTGINVLRAVSARAANDVWAAGAAGIQTLALHWDGTSWSVVATPNVGSGQNYFLGITAVSANDAWAVGGSCSDANCTATGTSLIERWNGTTWSVVTSPNPGSFFTELKTVIAVSANDVWATGSHSDDGSVWGNPTIHWDGTSWTYLPVPNPGAVDNDLRAFAVLSPNNIWVVGDLDNGSGEQTQIQHYTGPCGPTPTVTPCAMPFTDVHPTDYFYEAVRYLYCEGAISGYGTVFLPYNLTTRGQLTKIVTLAEGWTIYTPPTPTFRDVPTTNAFYTYIETAYHQGVISGYGCGTGCLEFRPGNNVTRAQLSKIIVSAEGWASYTPPSPTFRDVPSTDPFYTFIETAYYHSIISGYSCGTGCLEFRPSANATRGQICKIVYLAVTAP